MAQRKDEDTDPAGEQFTEPVTVRVSKRQLVALDKKCRQVAVKRSTYVRMKILEDIDWESEPVPKK